MSLLFSSVGAPHVCRTSSKTPAGFRKLCLVMGVLLATGSYAAYALDVDPSATNTSQTPADAKQQKDKEVTLKKVDVTATAAPKVDPTAAYTENVISADVVRNLSQGASMTVQTMLNQEPSIFAYTNGPLGVSTSIYFRAFNTSQFSETYAGVALNDIFNGGVTGQAENRNNVLLTTNNIDSVQLYRGINNPAVNSYNSLGGTINYVPRQPGDTFAGEVGAS